MKKVKYFLISFLFFQLSLCAKENNFEKSYQNYLEQFYIAQETPKNEAIELYTKCKDLYEKEKSEKNLINYINSCTLLSKIYSSGQMGEYKEIVEGFYDEIVTYLNIKKISNKLLFTISDYIYSEFAWKKDTSKNVSVLHNIYRKILSKEKNNEKALLKLSLWYIYASNYNTSNWNAFIIQQEEKIETLNKTDKFDAYLLYSIFYLRNYNTQKSKLYLEKAKQLYIDNPNSYILEHNFSKGIKGW